LLPTAASLKMPRRNALAWQNMQAQLRAAGMEIENLVKITTIDRAAVAKVRAGRAAVLGTHRAAGTLIIGGLSNPAWKIEVEGIGVA
jgi:2-iminobutanoate/2-iminopropanoate deaminase